MFRFVVLLYVLIGIQLLSVAQNKSIALSIRGVESSQVNVKYYHGLGWKSIGTDVINLKKNGQTTVSVPDSLLPCELQLQFKSIAKAGDKPTDTQTSLFINKEDIKVSINPLYVHPDSIYLEGDRENTIWNSILRKSFGERKQIASISNFLASYNLKNSKLYKLALKEYRNKVNEYNSWIESKKNEHSDLFISHLLYSFTLKNINWILSPEKQIEQEKVNYFNSFDYKDNLQLRSIKIQSYIGDYVTLYVRTARSVKERNTLLIEAAENACGVARNMDSEVYGSMVDYFYVGFETFGIQEGAMALAKYACDLNCPTKYREKILKRIEGLKVLKKGRKLKPFKVCTIDNKEQLIDFSSNDSKYHLLVFYASDCGDCHGLLNQLRSWIENPDHNAWVDITSISVDENIETWKNYRSEQYNWKDYYASGGMFGSIAKQFFILATPGIFLVDKDGQLVGIPKSISDLNSMLF
jgi:hypothetical protein